MSVSSNLRRCVCAVAVLATFAAAAPARAQQATPAPPAPLAARDTSAKRLSPRTAFIRSLIIPGWGQFSAGAEKRAVTFALLQSSSWYMLAKTLNKLSDAHKIETMRITLVTDTLRAQMQRDTALARVLSADSAFKNRIDAADTVVASRSLITSREAQRQDWITYTLFLTLASGVDAFVAAHLADFPATISTGPRPNGAFQLKLTMPARRRP